MAKNTSTVVKVMTTAGRAVYPHTKVPVKYDQAAKKSVPDPDGKFDCNIAFADTDPMVAKLQKLCKDTARDAGLKNPKLMPWKAELDKEQEETGHTIFTFKAYGKTRDGDEARVPHFDVKAKPLVDYTLTGGSTIKIAGRVRTYKELGGGVSLIMDSIQVINAASYENNPFDDESGEGDDEDGNEATAQDSFADESGSTDF